MKSLLIVYIVHIVLGFGGMAFAQATEPGTYYVEETVLEERLAPTKKGNVTNRLYRGQKVQVFEIKDGWARVSKYYDGGIEGKSVKVARWVLVSGLSARQHPTFPEDPRIAKDAFPNVGEHGLTREDILILYKGAIKYLNSGQCSRVEYGDKSINKPNTYFITCGGRNIFFKPSDVEDVVLQDIN